VRVFATYNIKGGVGKTSSAVNLAYLAASEGRRTLIWDLDPQGAASYLFRIKSKVKGGGGALLKGRRELDAAIKGTDFEGLDLLPADFSYRKMDLTLGSLDKPAKRLAWLLQSVEGAYDDVFLDCPPSISLLSQAVFVASDALLVPTIPTTLSLRMLDKLKTHLAKRKRFRSAQLLPFFCMVDCRKRLHREITAGAGSERSFLSSTVPYSSLVEQMSVHRAPVNAFARWSSPARSYADLWVEIQQRLATGDGRRPAGLAEAGAAPS
jgi:cellulose biosynthesis protein BcsQ